MCRSPRLWQAKNRSGFRFRERRTLTWISALAVAGIGGFNGWLFLAISLCEDVRSTAGVVYGIKSRRIAAEAGLDYVEDACTAVVHRTQVRAA